MSYKAFCANLGSRLRTPAGVSALLGLVAIAAGANEAAAVVGDATVTGSDAIATVLATLLLKGGSR